MTDDIYVYILPLPDKVREMVTPCVGGYTVYISDKLDKAGRERAFDHALQHIRRNDFASPLPADEIEERTHVGTEGREQI